MVTPHEWSGSYEIRVTQAADGFVVDVRCDGVVLQRMAGVSIEQAGPSAAALLINDLSTHAGGARG